MSRARTPKYCHICGKPMVALCDATRKDGKPCNLPMCKEHRNKVGQDVDVCKYHNYPGYIEQAKINRVKRKEARKYFMEEYPRQKIHVVPEHWPDFATVEEVNKWFEMLNHGAETFDKLPRAKIL